MRACTATSWTKGFLHPDFPLSLGLHGASHCSESGGTQAWKMHVSSTGAPFSLLPRKIHVPLPSGCSLQAGGSGATGPPSVCVPPTDTHITEAAQGCPFPPPQTPSGAGPSEVTELGTMWESAILTLWLLGYRRATSRDISHSGHGRVTLGRTCYLERPLDPPRDPLPG